MDLAEFAVIRAPRTPAPQQTVTLAAGRLLVIQPENPPKGEPARVEKVIGIESLPDSLGPVPEDPFAEITDPAGATHHDRILAFLRDLERALAAGNDQLGGDDLTDVVEARLRLHGLLEIDWARVFDTAGMTAACVPVIGLIVLRHHLVLTMTAAEPDYDRGIRLTRLVLVAAVAEQLAARRALTADEVFAMLHRMPVVIPELSADEMSGTPKVALIREARVSDLQVVRREWVGYLPGEVANVRNVMRGEAFTQHELTVRETGTTLENTTENRDTTESSTESRLESELTTEVTSQLGVTINGHVEGSAEFKYPVVTARVSAGVDAGMSLQRSERQAGKIAREAVARATSRVDSLTRESRLRRESSRTEQGMDYSLRNSGEDNLHGIYRWVDRVDAYQLFRYTDRLLLEFQIPEPAEFHRWRTARTAATTAAVDKPPAWTLSAGDITAAGLITLASTYRATNLPAAPDTTVTVLRTLTAAVGREAMPGQDDKPSNPPTAAAEVDIPIPDDYAAVGISYEGESWPMIGRFKDDRDNDLYGLRSGFATVAVGSQAKVFWNGGIQTQPDGSLVFLSTNSPTNQDLGTVEDVQSGNVPYGRSFVPITSTDGLIPDPVMVELPATPTLVRVAISTLAVLSCTVTFAVRCELTANARQAWQLSVYDALFAAWSQWKRDYEAAQVRDAFLGGTGAADAGSSQRNEQIIREELKRQVIAWLLDDEAFDGRPALHDRPAAGGFADMDIAASMAAAPTIQFLEQAFEWSNLGWMFYPYFWADREKWPELSQITADDPEFERFLRAGSSRVVLPTRPGFDDSVHNWLRTGVPFIDGQLPSPGDDLFVSLDTEVREITSPIPGGIPGDHWQTRLTTTLMYLEDQADLPFVNTLHQLPAPQGVPYIPDLIIDPNP